MPKAVINKLISVIILIAAICVLYVSLTGSETFRWIALGLTALASLNLYRVC